MASTFAPTHAPPTEDPLPKGMSRENYRRQSLSHRQAEVLTVIETYHQATGEGCPVTYIAKRLGLHHETVREYVQVLFAKSLVMGPGSPVTPSDPIVLPMKNTHLIYFLLNIRARLIKIGRTTNLENRCREIQRQCGSLVMLIGAVQSTEMTEKRWHVKFSASRVTGEWFALTEEVRDELAARFGIDLTHWMCEPPSYYQI